MLCRVSLAAAALHLVIWRIRHHDARAFRRWRVFLLMGLLSNVIPFSLIFWGQPEIPSGLASILNATTPLFTVAASRSFTADERRRRHAGRCRRAVRSGRGRR